MKKEKILITGGAGYIGSVMTPLFLREGYKVTILDNFKFRQNSLLDVCSNNDLTVVRGDVRNESLLKRLVAENDIIIPLAAIVGAPACQNEFDEALAINKIQIAHIAKTLSKDQKIVFPVTNSGYGVGEQGVYCDENSPLRPLSHYGKTKVEAEKILLDRGNAVTLRLATVFGTSPRMRMDLLVNDFVYRATKDRFIVLFESHFKRNYIHIRDVVYAFMHALNHYDEMKGEPYNLGLSDANLSKLELCFKIKSLLPEFSIFESEFASDPDKRDYIVSNNKIESTGWAPKYALEDGIAELIKAYGFLSVNPYQNVL